MTYPMHAPTTPATPTMRPALQALAATLALTLALAPGWVQAQATEHAEHAEHGAHADATPAADSQALSEGEVTRFDARSNKVTLRHGELKNLGMPGMTMVFQLRTSAPAPALKPGDKVRFRAEQDNGSFVVTALEVLR